jgi:hypothetical protein
MDQDFFTDLEAAFTGAGADTLWKRRVNGILIWLSPLTMNGQAKLVETIEGYKGPNTYGESKRVTLSHSIVGVNDTDLRQYRDGAAVFPQMNRKGEMVNVPLDKYLYGKMGGWGSQFVDDLYTVFGDMSETVEKQNLKDVKFENSKDPREELAEHMAKVAELRDQLGMKPLVDPDEDPRYLGKSQSEQSEEGAADSPPDAEPADPVPSFDPFARIDPSRSPTHASPAVPAPVPVPVPVPPSHPTPGMEMPPPMAAVAPIPAPVPSTTFNRPGVDRPIHVGMPSVPSEIMEESTARTTVAPPVIDRPAGNRNPRFSPSR